MKLNKLILLPILVLLCASGILAQSPYLGGSGCGVAKASYAQATMNIFGGGSADGYSKLHKAQTDQVNTNLGGIGDGYAKYLFAQPDQVSVFFGGIADGYAKLHYSQSTMSSMFFGGIADGYAKSHYSQVMLGNMFFGGIADGYAKSTYAQADPAIPEVNFIASDSTICVGTCISFTDLSTEGPTSWNWSFPGASITSSTVQNPTNICYNTAGTYTVKLRATNTIGTDSTTKTGYIVVSPLPTANAGTDVAICNGASTTLNASGGTSYSWSPSTGLSSATISNPVATPGSTTTYTVTVTSAAGCTASDAVTVTIKPLPTVSVSPITICAGTSGTLTASGATSYTWANAAGLSSTTGTSVTANPASTTTYTVTGTLNGCNNTSTVLVTVTPAPPANAGTDATICNGGTTTLNATGGSSYSWSPAATLSASNISNPVASATTTTNYTVTVTSGACSATDVVTVTVNPLPLADAGNNVSICTGASTTLSASGGNSYSWSPGAGLSLTNISNPIANPTVTTTYTVTVGTAAGCTATDAVTVSVNPIPTANAGNDVTICNGSSTTLNASGGTSYSWSPATGLNNSNIANPIADPSSTTTYTVTVNSGGCTATDAVVVTVTPLPSANAGTDVTICSGASTNLSASGGTAYSWSPATGLSSAVIPNPVASPAVTTSYTVTVTASGCSATDVVVVNINQPLADAGSDVSICTGASVTLNASGGTIYSWSPAGSLSSASIANPVANPTSTTTYTVTVTNNGCSATDAVTVTVNSSLIADAGTDVTICNGSAAFLNATGGASYTWSPSTGLNSTTIANPVATPATTTTYTVTASSGGCSSTDAVTVVVNPLPPANITADGPITFCQGDSVILSAPNGYTYLWSGGQNTGSITVLVSGSYNVAVTSGDGCTSTSSAINVTVPAITPSSITANGSTTFCSGDSVTLTASLGSAYNWSTGATTQSITVMTADDYSVAVSDVNGCSVSSDTIAVTVNPNPAVPSISPAGIYNICVGDTVTLSTVSANAYQWSNGSTGSTLDVTTAGFYGVTVFNSFGCGTSSGSMTEVTVNDPVNDFTATPLLVFIPSANVNYTAATNGSGPFTYLWDFGDATTSSLASPSHTYNNIGFKTVTLTVADSTGCSKTISKPGYIQVEQLFPSTALTTGTTIDISGVSFVDGATGIFTLTDGNCIVTLDTGNTFSPMPTGNTHALTGASLLPGDWFVTGDSGTIMHSLNNGSNWIPFSTGTLERFNGSSFSAITNGFAVGTNGTIQKYNGGTWSPEISGTSDHLNAVEALVTGDAIAVGDNQTILKYNGTSWSPQSSPLNFDIKGIRFSSATDGYAVGTGGIIIKTTDGGNTWSPSLTGIAEDFNSVTVQGPDSAWATGTGGVVYTTTDNGATWIRYSVGHLGTQTAITKRQGGKGHVVGHGGNGRVFDRGATGISVGTATDEKNLNTLKVYPNPAHHYVSIEILHHSNEDIRIEFKDVNGKALETIETPAGSGMMTTELNIEAYSSGVYFIHVQQGKQYQVKKLVIQK